MRLLDVITHSIGQLPDYFIVELLLPFLLLLCSKFSQRISAIDITLKIKNR
jgi:hypothetical protein